MNPVRSKNLNNSADAPKASRTANGMKRVFVGLSGGVDSSVAALLLKQQGYKVIGVYMKNWSQDLPGMKCPWKEDYQDAKRIAVQLGIDFKVYDFQKEYRRKVVDYMLDEFKAGRTPNPDIICNQEIKFKLFLETVLENGANLIATGHYARVVKGPTSHNSHKMSTSEVNVRGRTFHMLMAKDENKDQTYFLYRMTKEALQKTLFPLGELTKPQVRKLAEKNNLVTAAKKESMGICFVGKVPIKNFLSQYVKPKPGKIIDQNGVIVGEHDGAIFYTIGQRRGLEIGGGLPYYVTGKDMKKNEIYVTTDLQDENLWSSEIKLTDMHWINGDPSLKQETRNKKHEKNRVSQFVFHNSLYVRTRHRAPLVKVEELQKIEPKQWTAVVAEDIRALTPGQSAVFYSDQVCLGGGIVI